jgi:hypothetical protein
VRECIRLVLIVGISIDFQLKHGYRNHRKHSGAHRVSHSTQRRERERELVLGRSLTFAVIGGLGEVDRVDGASKCASGLKVAGRKHDVALGISTR